MVKIRLPRNKNRRYIALALLATLAAALVLASILFIYDKEVDAPAETPQLNTENSEETKEEVKKESESTPAPTEAAQTPQYPVTLSQAQASSITAVINKKHRLPSDYTPALVSVLGGQLRSEAASALQNLFDDADVAGHSLKIISSYRSYQTQVSTYNGWVAQYGQAEADTFSARPGHSEHQTGLAVDVAYSDGSYALEQSFGTTGAGQWIAANAQNYGFIIRYPEGREAETGYTYEPWHLRFVGVDTAKAIAGSGKTMDEYLNVPAGGY